MNRSVIASSVRVGFDTLKANPLRTLLSTLGIIMGVGSMISVLSLGDGVERYARSQIATSTDLQMMSLAPRTTQMIDGVPFPRTDYPVFSHADADSLEGVLAGAGRVAIQAQGQALATRLNDTTRRALQVIGVGTAWASVHEPKLAAGRWPTDAEIRRVAPVAVLSAQLARDLAAPREASTLVGDSVRLQGVVRQVVGVIAAPARGPSLKLAYVPFGALAEVVVRQNAPRTATMLVKVNRMEDVTPMRARVESWLAARYGDWKEQVTLGIRAERVQQAQQGILIFKLLMGTLTGISLLVGGIGIMNVLLASVVERTREIGIRRAAGAQQRHILFQFLSESVTISGTGSLVGIALGVAVAYAATAVMRSMTGAIVYAGFSVSTLVVGVMASVLVGLIFGLYPAMKAARLSPIEAMHHE